MEIYQPDANPVVCAALCFGGCLAGCAAACALDGIIPIADIAGATVVNASATTVTTNSVFNI